MVQLQPGVTAAYSLVMHPPGRRVHCAMIAAARTFLVAVLLACTWHHAAAKPCICPGEQQLCSPLATPIPETEVLVFAVTNGAENKSQQLNNFRTGYRWGAWLGGACQPSLVTLSSLA